MATERTTIALGCYEAFASGDRAHMEAVLADDFRFSSPVDVGLDRAGFFERCWPNAGSVTAFDFVRIVEAGDTVVVTYEARRRDGTRFRNTEVFAFDGDRVRAQEVYFGWNL